MNESCNACGSDRFRMFNQINKDIYLLQCENCQLVFQPEPKLIEFNQSMETYGEDNLQFRLSIQSILMKQARLRLAWIEKYQNPGHLLEIGGATGEFCFEAKKHGWTTTMLELSESFVKEATNQGINVHRKILTQDSFGPSSFDCIAMFHVLEHLPNPAENLSIANNLLTNNGVIAFIVPNLHSLTDRLFGNKNQDINKLDHIYHFSVNALEKLMYRTGFGLLDLRTIEPVHHWATSLYGFFSSGIENRRTKAKPKNKKNFKSMLPYWIGQASSPITFFYRKYLEKCNKGHEVWCLARKTKIL